MARATVPLSARIPGETTVEVPLLPLFADAVGEARWGRDFMRVYDVSIAERAQQFSLYSD